MLGGLAAFSTVPDWLTVIADPELVADALRGSPAFRLGAIALERVDVGRVRLRKQRWTGLYELAVVDQAGVHRDVALEGTLVRSADGAQGLFDTERWCGYVPALGLALEPQTAEKVLGDLDPLTDPATAGGLLEFVIRGGSKAYDDLRVATCTPEIVRYKPGSRATVLLHVGYAAADQDRGWPDRVIAKTYRDLRGADAYEAMVALWSSRLLDRDRLTLAEPLAFDPDLRILAQRHIPHTGTLRGLVREARRSGSAASAAELDEYVRMTGAALAALHATGAEVGPPRGYDEELGDLREDLDELTRAAPQLEGAAGRFLASLADLAGRCPADPAVPSHGAFRPGQVLLTPDGRVAFIDFDGACHAEPAFDVAEFLGKLRSTALTVGKGEDETVDDAHLPALLARADELGALFLSAYERHRPLTRQRVALWEGLTLLTRLVDGWTKVKPDRLRMSLMLMRRFLAAHPEIAA